MYKTHTRSLHERKDLIGRAVKSSEETYPFYEYQNTRSDLPLIRLDIDVPIYRMANYRTRIAQLQYIHDHDSSADFFQNGQENESAQQAQNDLLLVFAKQGRTGSIAPIYEELETEEQREPLLMTAGGVVVNGNRRLAAMRELFTTRPNEFRHFSHAYGAVLPGNVTADEVREIEVRLQMRPETKLPYAWVNESLAIQELLQSGRKSDYIADLMKKKKKEVERAATALTEADIYLKEWLREPGEYQYVEDAEQFFNDLAKALEGKQGEALETSRRIAWSLLSSRNLTRRVYDYRFSFDRRTDEVASALADRLNVDLTAPSQHELDIEDLDIDLDGDNGETSLDPLIEVFDDPSRRDVVTDELIAVCDSILEQDKQGEAGRRALASVQAANSKLQEVDLTKADPATYIALGKQLDSITDRAAKLTTTLQAYKADKDGSGHRKA